MSKAICVLVVAALCLSTVLAIGGSSFRPSMSHSMSHSSMSRPSMSHSMSHSSMHRPSMSHSTPIHNTVRPHAPIHTPIHNPIHTPIHTPRPQPVHTPRPQPVHTPRPQPVHTPRPQPVHTPTPVHTPRPQPVHTPTPVHTPRPQPVHTPTPAAPVKTGSVSYPHYSQGDAQWKTQHLGNSGSTIGAKGCLMSSVASMVAGNGGKVNGQTPNPATMNQWLKSNGGFSGNNFVWGSLKPLGYNFEGKVGGKDSAVSALNSGKNVLLNVNGGHHYVLATGHDATGYTVMDPGYSKTHYNFNEVVQAGVYKRQ